jgi:hypothetical protein
MVLGLDLSKELIEIMEQLCYSNPIFFTIRVFTPFL